MASTSNPSSRPPATGVIVPKMEHPPQDTKLAEVPDKDNASGEAWTSEMQYVSSLAKLQKMETTVGFPSPCVDRMFKLTSADPPTTDSNLWASHGADSPHRQPQGGCEEAAAKVAAGAL
jgi:hypothetical protein